MEGKKFLMWYIQYVVKVECILDRVDLVAKVSDRK